MEYRPKEADEVMEVLRGLLVAEYPVAFRRASAEKLARLDDLLDKFVVELLTGE